MKEIDWHKLTYEHKFWKPPQADEPVPYEEADITEWFQPLDARATVRFQRWPATTKFVLDWNDHERVMHTVLVSLPHSAFLENADKTLNAAIRDARLQVDEYTGAAAAKRAYMKMVTEAALIQYMGLGFREDIQERMEIARLN